MKIIKRCGICNKTAIQIRNDAGKVENTSDIYIDKWGYTRNFCKECMKKKGNKQSWK